jgi:hypothetical protein
MDKLHFHTPSLNLQQVQIAGTMIIPILQMQKQVLRGQSEEMVELRSEPRFSDSR